MSEELLEYYKKDAKNYEKRRFNRGGSLVHEVEIGILLDFLRLSAEDMVLDIGGGTGRFERAVEEQGSSIVLCDLTREMLDIAKEDVEPFLVLANVFNLPFKDCTFDKCVGLRFLFHFDDDKKIKILEEIIRVTKKKGVFVFDVHNSGGLLNFMSILRKDRMNFPISPETLEKILSKLPLTRYHVHFSFFIPRGIYRHIPKQSARFLLSLDRFLPDVIKRKKCSALFFRGVCS